MKESQGTRCKLSDTINETCRLGETCEAVKLLTLHRARRVMELENVDELHEYFIISYMDHYLLSGGSGAEHRN